MSQRNKCVDLQNLKDDRLIVERTRKTHGSPNIRTKQKPEVVRLRVFTGHLLFRLAHRSFSEGGWKDNRVQNDFAWKIPIAEIESRNYNLDFKNPNGGAKVEHSDPEETLNCILNTEREIMKISEEIKGAL